MIKPVVVCGPTASGKTALAIALAQRLDGEIVSADSMQIYRGMDIGTAKPDRRERSMAVHHMIDVAEPGESFSAARYSAEASCITDDIIARGKTPIICGGTGLYINALINGTDFAVSGDDNGIRAKLENEYHSTSAEHMHKRLRAVDPESAERLHINDVKRVIRALEVYESTGKTITEYNRLSKTVKPRYDAIFIGIAPYERQILYDRINRRVDVMLSIGLEAEVRLLYESGRLINTAAQAIGYKEMLAYIRDEASLAEAAELIKQKSRNYAKRQLTWFKSDKRVNWVGYDTDFDIDGLCQKATSFVR
ncbi:MAG: tRNA (adenosine(37)-N6)-dimethylallyltransferase MiaA [Clostridia bacterium]|nr:tRNA (adenosine(37)-N6)-dimethylallyltransferase MiaA [Clostridia bacterium]